MQYLKRFWDESRGDEYDHWGTSMWYFEISQDNFPVRQIEVYTSGKILKYSEDNIEDDFGGLSYVALEPDDYETITKTEFEGIWHN